MNPSCCRFTTTRSAFPNAAQTQTNLSTQEVRYLDCVRFGLCNYTTCWLSLFAAPCPLRPEHSGTLKDFNRSQTRVVLSGWSVLRSVCPELFVCSQENMRGVAAGCCCPAGLWRPIISKDVRVEHTETDVTLYNTCRNICKQERGQESLLLLLLLCRIFSFSSMEAEWRQPTHYRTHSLSLSHWEHDLFIHTKKNNDLLQLPFVQILHKYIILIWKMILEFVAGGFPAAGWCRWGRVKTKKKNLHCTCWKCDQELDFKTILGSSRVLDLRPSYGSCSGGCCAPRILTFLHSQLSLSPRIHLLTVVSGQNRCGPPPPDPPPPHRIKLTGVHLITSITSTSVGGFPSLRWAQITKTLISHPASARR